MDKETTKDQDQPLPSFSKSFGFDVCGPLFTYPSSSSSLEECHRMNPTPMEYEGKHKCELCFYATDQSSNFRKHILSHAVEKKHQCPRCDYAFIQKENLEKHLRTHPVEQSFPCRTCGMTFSQLKNLRIHQHKHTRESHGDRILARLLSQKEPTDLNCAIITPISQATSNKISSPKLVRNRNSAPSVLQHSLESNLSRTPSASTVLQHSLESNLSRTPSASTVLQHSPGSNLPRTPSAPTRDSDVCPAASTSRQSLESRPYVSPSESTSGASASASLLGRHHRPRDLPRSRMLKNGVNAPANVQIDTGIMNFSHTHNEQVQKGL